MGRPSKYTPELRRRAVGEVLDHGRPIPAVAGALGIKTPETLRRWVVQEKIDRGLVTGPTTEELAEIKALRREVADQQRTIEILKAATTYVGDRCQGNASGQLACSLSRRLRSPSKIFSRATWPLSRASSRCLRSVGLNSMVVTK